MSLDAVYLCPRCSEPLERPDAETSELVCPGCGTSFKNPDFAKPRFVPDGSGIDSPGMVNPLGTSQREVVRELQRKNRLCLSLHDLWNAGEDAFWIRLTQALKDQGLSEEKIALASAAIRLEIRHLKRKKTEELRDILRRFGVEA